jgi:hypothetical protein
MHNFSFSNEIMHQLLPTFPYQTWSLTKAFALAIPRADPATSRRTLGKRRIEHQRHELSFDAVIGDNGQGAKNCGWVLDICIT